MMGILPPCTLSDARFLLIQKEVLSIMVRPDALEYSLVDEEASFQVAIGCVNEFGKAEIVGIIARAIPRSGCNTWLVSSELDEYNRLVGAAGTMTEFIKSRLYTYWLQGKFSDLCNLPQPVLIRGA